MNKQTIIGRIGADAKVCKSKEGELISFSVAAESGFGDFKKLEWVDCLKFGKTNISEFLKKGILIYLSGECWSEEFKGKVRRKIRVDQIELLSSKRSDDES